MNNINPSKPIADLVPSYIFATSSDANFQADRESLRKIGMIVNCRLSSSNALLDYIRNNVIHTTIFDSSLSGCVLSDLIFQVRKYLRGTAMNMCVISDISEENFVIDVITAGCTGFIIRPYALETLKRHVRIKYEADEISINEELLGEGQKNLLEGNYDAAIDEFEEIVADNTDDTLDEARKFFEMGTEYILRRKFGKAIIAFNNALRVNHLFIKAYEGLAQAYHGKGDNDKYQEYLQKAADEYARMDNFADVKRIFAEITKNDINAPNAYNSLGIELRHKKMYGEAIHAYIKALKISPKDENIYYNLAKAQIFAKQYEEALTSIRNCLHIRSDHNEALDLYKRFTSTNWNENKNALLNAEENSNLN